MTRRPTTQSSTIQAYAGSGTEVVDDIKPGAVSISRLLAVAAWHEHPSRRTQRHRVIADKLRDLAANDNGRAA
ncbi:hypothetical protein [Rhizobium laguerreae]|uniref:hypothetical protein n=1 Tax=Rhizobium laguerreae TaxID=1076926 RepID=UPI001C919A0A|nr:hypothetical protein [Rhizobium laguerreae]MBY3434875.1 hypothetical protein [Rhizobium laguerreae]MBY3449017.1 hypothetical protein [Rhizobium laguerreae]MBY3456791.1 hypothetical protein [Rhizobium laguerreae]